MICAFCDRGAVFDLVHAVKVCRPCASAIGRMARDSEPDDSRSHLAFRAGVRRDETSPRRATRSRPRSDGRHRRGRPRRAQNSADSAASPRRGHRAHPFAAVLAPLELTTAGSQRPARNRRAVEVSRSQPDDRLPLVARAGSRLLRAPSQAVLTGAGTSDSRAIRMPAKSFSLRAARVLTRAGTLEPVTSRNWRAAREQPRDDERHAVSLLALEPVATSAVACGTRHRANSYFLIDRFPAHVSVVTRSSERSISRRSDVEPCARCAAGTIREVIVHPIARHGANTEDRIRGCMKLS